MLTSHRASTFSKVIVTRLRSSRGVGASALLTDIVVVLVTEGGVELVDLAHQGVEPSVEPLACHTAVLSERRATRDFKMALPGDLVDNPPPAR